MGLQIQDTGPFQLIQRAQFANQTISSLRPSTTTAALIEELVEEILLRFPPGDPASLLRAALVCKGWCCFVSGAAFRRRFRERHGTPPVLGLLLNDLARRGTTGRFLRTSSFFPVRRYLLHGYPCVHSAHGRVLFWDLGDTVKGLLLVWDPITGRLWHLPTLPWRPYLSSKTWNAAVLCAGTCNHLDCHRGPFLVVFVAGISADSTAASVYSSETGAWSKPISTNELNDHEQWCLASKALARDAIYFINRSDTEILRFDLITLELSAIRLPDEASRQLIVLVALEDGRPGFATVQESKLCLWCSEILFPDRDTTTPLNQTSA